VLEHPKINNGPKNQLREGGRPRESAVKARQQREREWWSTEQRESENN